MSDEWMMKRAFCARCDLDMGMMIADWSPHPTCPDCIDRQMGHWVIARRAAPYLGAVAIAAVVAAIAVYGR
jgi:hypothetical protein